MEQAAAASHVLLLLLLLLLPVLPAQLLFDELLSRIASRGTVRTGVLIPVAN